jgi:hypothetical protein
MKIAVMQPYFFPYVGYFQAIHVVDKYILYDDLNFIKESWMNRNRFLLKNGNSCYFNVPLKKKSSVNKIYEIELIDNDNWRKNILNGIFLNYKKAKYFDDVYPLIEYVVNYPTEKLTELNFQSINCVCGYLNVKTEISKDSVKYNDIEIKLAAENLDEKDFPELKLTEWRRKVVRVLEICRMEGADIFINAIGGINLYPKDVFFQNGIELKFIKTRNIEYKQFDNEFVPNLSIIDVMMFKSPDDIKSLLNEYEFV